MDNMTFAAQAVANGPMTSAPASFNGHGWLVVVNLALMTGAALVCAMALIKQITEMLSERGGEWRGPLVMLLRTIMAIAFGGMMIRTGAEAISLWGWNPLDPTRTGWYLTLKRFLDPFGGGAYIVATCLYISTEDALVGALERKPFPDRLVAALPKLRRPAILLAMTLTTSIAVVSLR